MSGPLPAAVLWDLDGTLVDTEPYWMATEQELVASFGGTWTHEQGLALVGNPLVTSGAVLQEAGGVDLPVEQIVDRLIAGVVARVQEHIPWRPGARELLDALAAAGVPCALVTMSYRSLAEAVVRSLPEPRFTVMVTGDEVTHGKPHPEPYLTAAKLVGFSPGECVAIEDSPTGVASAEAAGVPTLAVRHLIELPPGPGRLVASSLTGWTPARLVKVRALLGTSA